MEEARKAVEEFMTKAGHHDTTVLEKVAPAVTHSFVTRHEHEDVQEVLDKSLHQKHYHISVQPVYDDEETLPEQHRFNLVAPEHRNFDHDDAAEVQRRLSEETAKFKDELVHIEGHKSSNSLPVLTAEHYHHHVHELIQPVVDKKVIEPIVIHTIIPIHEIHHQAAQHHATSTLPTVTMAEFKKQGGVLTGREERYDFFQGEPRSVGKALGGSSHASTQPASSQTAAAGKGSSTGQSGSNNGAPGSANATTGTVPTATAAAAKPSLLDRLKSPKPAESDSNKSGPAQSSQAQPSQAAQSGSSNAVPPAPPQPPHPSALSLVHPPTYLSKAIYNRTHPGPTSGTRATTPAGTTSNAGQSATDKPLPDRP